MDYTSCSIQHCVAEFVEYAIRCKSSHVAVRINLQSFKIQIVDNGNGISKEQLELLVADDSINEQDGYAVLQLDQMFLRRMVKCCSRLLFVSKVSGDGKTYCKIFQKSGLLDVVESLHDRLSKGTTVIIFDYLENIPTRQRCVVQSLELLHVKQYLQAMALVYPSICFILRDDTTDTVMLKTNRSSSSLRTFIDLFPEVIRSSSSVERLMYQKDDVKIKAMISKEIHVTDEFQFIYVNKQHIAKAKIHRYFCKLLTRSFYLKDTSKETVNSVSSESPFARCTKNAIYVLNIQCPRDEYTFTWELNKRRVNFKNWDYIFECLDKLVNRFVKISDVSSKNAAADEQKIVKNKASKSFKPNFRFQKFNHANTLFGPAVNRGKKMVDITKTSFNPASNQNLEKTKLELLRKMKSFNSKKNKKGLPKKVQRIDTCADMQASIEGCTSQHDDNTTCDEIPLRKLSPGTPVFTRLSEKPLVFSKDLREHPSQVENYKKSLAMMKKRMLGKSISSASCKTSSRIKRFNNKFNIDLRKMYQQYVMNNKLARMKRKYLLTNENMDAVNSDFQNLYGRNHRKESSGVQCTEEVEEMPSNVSCVVENVKNGQLHRQVPRHGVVNVDRRLNQKGQPDQNVKVTQVKAINSSTEFKWNPKIDCPTDTGILSKILCEKIVKKTTIEFKNQNQESVKSVDYYVSEKKHFWTNEQAPGARGNQNTNRQNSAQRRRIANTKIKFQRHRIPQNGQIKRDNHVQMCLRNDKVISTKNQVQDNKVKTSKRTEKEIRPNTVENSNSTLNVFSKPFFRYNNQIKRQQQLHVTDKPQLVPTCNRSQQIEVNKKRGYATGNRLIVPDRTRTSVETRDAKRPVGLNVLHKQRASQHISQKKSRNSEFLDSFGRKLQLKSQLIVPNKVANVTNRNTKTRDKHFNIPCKKVLQNSNNITDFFSVTKNKSDLFGKEMSEPDNLFPSLNSRKIMDCVQSNGKISKLKISEKTYNFLPSKNSGKIMDNFQKNGNLDERRMKSFQRRNTRGKSGNVCIKDSRNDATDIVDAFELHQFRGKKNIYSEKDIDDDDSFEIFRESNFNFKNPCFPENVAAAKPNLEHKNRDSCNVNLNEDIMSEVVPFGCNPHKAPKVKGLFLNDDCKTMVEQNKRIQNRPLLNFEMRHKSKNNEMAYCNEFLEPFKNVPRDTCLKNDPFLCDKRIVDRKQKSNFFNLIGMYPREQNRTLQRDKPGLKSSELNLPFKSKGAKVSTNRKVNSVGNHQSTVFVDQMVSQTMPHTDTDKQFEVTFNEDQMSITSNSDALFELSEVINDLHLSSPGSVNKATNQNLPIHSAGNDENSSRFYVQQDVGKELALLGIGNSKNNFASTNKKNKRSYDIFQLNNTHEGLTSEVVDGVVDTNFRGVSVLEWLDNSQHIATSDAANVTLMSAENNSQRNGTCEENELTENSCNTGDSAEVSDSNKGLRIDARKNKEFVTADAYNSTDATSGSDSNKLVRINAQSNQEFMIMEIENNRESHLNKKLGNNYLGLNAANGLPGSIKSLENNSQPNKINKRSTALEPENEASNDNCTTSEPNQGLRTNSQQKATEESVVSDVNNEKNTLFAITSNSGARLANNLQQNTTNEAEIPADTLNSSTNTYERSMMVLASFNPSTNFIDNTSINILKTIDAFPELPTGRENDTCLNKIDEFIQVPKDGIIESIQTKTANNSVKICSKEISGSETCTSENEFHMGIINEQITSENKFDLDNTLINEREAHEDITSDVISSKDNSPIDYCNFVCSTSTINSVYFQENIASSQFRTTDFQSDIIKKNDDLENTSMNTGNVAFGRTMRTLSMKYHPTIDDAGNSCLKIFPQLKKQNNSMQNIADSSNEDLNSSVVFQKADLKTIKFIKQIDDKFLLTEMVTKHTNGKVLVIFDQHAVDERERVESLLKTYINEHGKWRSATINPTVQPDLSIYDISVLIDFRSSFEKLGLKFEFGKPKASNRDRLVTVTSVPLCLYNRVFREESKIHFNTRMKELVDMLMKEVVQQLVKSDGRVIASIPNTLQEIINYEACRGAFKFGDKLTDEICQSLILNLQKCKLPFQCAHGRPLLAPLIDLVKVNPLEKKMRRSQFSVRGVRNPERSPRILELLVSSYRR